MSNDTMKSNALRLIENGSATGEYGRSVGGLHWLVAEGTWGGAVLTLQMKLANGTAYTLPGVSLSANGRVPVSLPIGADVRAVLTGGSPSAIYAYLVLARDGLGSEADASTPVGGMYNTTLPTYANGDRAQFQFGQRGGALVSILGNASTNIAAVSQALDGEAAALGLSTIGRNQIYNGTTWDRQVKANATARLLSAANTTNATVVKAAAGNIHKITGYNAAAALRYLKLYNKATAPTVGTDTPVWTEVLPATAKFSIDFGESPLYFATGIGFGLTTAGADADTGALTAGDVTGLNIAYS